MIRHVFTQTELHARGVRTRELDPKCRTGQLHELLPGVYCTRVPTTIDRCRAVTLWRPDAVLSHGTAAWLHGMLEEPAVIDAYVRELPDEPVPWWLRLRVPNCGIYNNDRESGPYVVRRAADMEAD
jgi:hypothetical protein